jgi:hypothetical protein
MEGLARLIAVILDDVNSFEITAIFMRVGHSLIAICLFMASCSGFKQTEPTGKEVRTLSAFTFSKQTDSLLQRYASEFPAPAYALFIDKKSELSSYRITIAPFRSKLKSLYESGSLNYILLNGNVPVFIYTGLEDFVACDSSAFLKAKEVPAELVEGEFRYWKRFYQLIDFTKSWSYIHDNDLAMPYVVKGDNAPFSELTLKPTIEFKSPSGSQ